jgi:SAM-dependent methyltransferase
MTCTLCGSATLSSIHTHGDRRTYFNCQNCSLIFADPRHHLSQRTERNRYALHKNSIEHAGYVDFLNRVIQPCLPFLTPGIDCLDYGCGPVPTLSKLLHRLNISCFDYDPLFGFDHPKEAYDFIFATECVEHFHYPKRDFLSIDKLLRRCGYLAVMTERWEDLDRFKTWYYKRDPTHVSFFHKNTFAWLCSNLGYEIKYADRNRVMVLRKL